MERFNKIKRNTFGKYFDLLLEKRKKNLIPYKLFINLNQLAYSHHDGTTCHTKKEKLFDRLSTILQKKSHTKP
jgi:hypothetical protein